MGVDRDDAFNDFFASTGAARYSGFRSFKTSLDCFMIQLCFLIEKKCVLTPFRPFVLCGVGYFAYHVMHKESESVANAAGVIYAPPKTAPVLEDEEELAEENKEIPDPEPIDQEQEGEAKHETDQDHTDKTAPSTSGTGGNPSSGKGWDAVRKSLNVNSASTSGTGGDKPGSGSSMLRDAVRKSITANAASTKGWNAVAKSISSNAAPNKRRRESLRKPGLSTRSFGIDTRSSSVTTTGTAASTIRKTSSKNSLSSINSDDSSSVDSDEEEDVVAVRGLNTRTSTSTSGGLNNRTSTSTSGSSGGSRRGQLRPSLSSRPSSGSRPSSNGGGPRPGRRRSTAGSSGVKKMGLSTRSFGINLAAQAAEVDSDSDDSSD